MRNPITGRDILKAALASAILTLAILVAVSYARSQELPRGPWPTGVSFPDDMVRYTPSKFTQSIAIVNGRDSIQKVPRSQMERKWRMPGGLENATGWRSDLYRLRDNAPITRIENIMVLNSLGYMQPNRGWTRQYWQGDKFMDVLSYNGRVFEIRMAIREPYKWHRFVDYRNESANPPGFVRIRTKDCDSCHRDSGSGNYGAALVPGGDGILSDPIPALEQ